MSSMVVTGAELDRALNEVNTAFAEDRERLTELEKRLSALEAPTTKPKKSAKATEKAKKDPEEPSEAFEIQ